MLSTTEITKRSFQLYKENWKPMLLLGAVVLVLAELTGTSAEGDISASVLALVLSVLVAPLTQGGYYFYLMNVWSEKPASVRDILYFCKSAGMYGKALCFFICYMIATSVIILFSFVPVLFAAFMNIPVHSMLIAYGITLLLLIPFFYLVLRLMLAPYLYVCDPEESAITVIAKSFEMMKGYVWKYILISLAVLLIELIYILPEYLLTSAGVNDGMVLALTFIPNLLVYPLVYLMTAGFACEVLREYGVIADENAELVEAGTESFACADSDVQDTLITEKNDDIYYDET